MKKLFSHPEIIMATFAIALFGVLVYFYFWATGAIVVQVRRALVAAPAEAAPSFNLDQATKLDLRGLLGQSASSAAALIPSAPAGTPSAPTPGAPGTLSSSTATDQQILQAFGEATATPSAATSSASAPASTAPSTTVTTATAATTTASGTSQ